MVAALPSVACGEAECAELRTMLADVRESGVEEALTGNLGEALEKEIAATAAQVRALGGAGFISAALSPELSLEQIRAMAKPMDTELVIYGRLPAMISETCLIKASSGRCTCTTPGQMAESIFHGYYSCFCTSFVQDDYSTSGKQAFFTVSQFIPTFIPSHVGINVF